MARTKKPAEAPADVNEAANRADLNSRSMPSDTTLHNELVVSEGMRIAALQECDRLRTEIETLKSAVTPLTKVVGIGALSRCLGYHAGLMLSFVHDGMPHTIEEGTAVFHLPTVLRWMLDRREARVLADRRAGVVEITSDNLDTIIDALNVVVTQTDAVMDACGDDWLEDPDTAAEVARLSNIQRHLRETVDHLAEMVA